MRASLHLKQFDAIIFDMDGVLVNSEPLWEESDIRIFQKEFGVGAYTKEYRTQFLGMSMEEEMKIIVADFKIAQNRIPRIIEARRNSLMGLYQDRLELFLGTRKLLQYFHGKKKTALASSSSLDLIGAVMERFKLGKYFDVLVSSQEVRHGKPFPDIFLYAARKLMVNPTKCLVIEDSVNGIRAGKAAGMKVVAVMQTIKDKEALSQADWIFDDLQSFYAKVVKQKV